MVQFKRTSTIDDVLKVDLSSLTKSQLKMLNPEVLVDLTHHLIINRTTPSSLTHDYNLVISSLQRVGDEVKAGREDNNALADATVTISKQLTAVTETVTNLQGELKALQRGNIVKSDDIIHNNIDSYNDNVEHIVKPPPHVEHYRDFNLTADELSCLKSLNCEYEKTSERETTYFGEFGYTYGSRTNRVKHQSSAYPPAIKVLIDKVNANIPTEQHVNSCLVSHYVNGESFIPPHTDNEAVIDPESDIFTFSIGCERDMRFTNIGSGEEVETISLAENSLVSFSRRSQDFYRHEIVADGSTKPRTSFTLRRIKPHYLNSTCIVGDSNTAPFKFGSVDSDNTGPRSKFGAWLPGRREHCGKIKAIPDPLTIGPHRNIVIHVGFQDLNQPSPLPPPVLVRELESKCSKIHKLYPHARIWLSEVTPSMDASLNYSIREFNTCLRFLSQKHHNLLLLRHHDRFADKYTGLLQSTLSVNKPGDIVHLNGKGISTLARSLKSNIMSRAKGMGPYMNFLRGEAEEYGSGGGRGGSRVRGSGGGRSGDWGRGRGRGGFDQRSYSTATLEGQS